ncbi:MAG TPA: T9SS type A sorting domain-containing protein [Flavisolibacter sp.]|nr:T9SS type A sorting domain-containing protein [Flavisolibacter sp.]
MKNLKLPFLLLSFCFFTLAEAQSLFKVPLDRKIEQSTLIVEGIVSGQKSFWNDKHTMIFTAHTVEVTKIFKGSLQQQTIEVMTQGGSVGGDHIEASDLLHLERGQRGIFFCQPNALQLKSPLTHRTLFDVYASSQGFFEYDASLRQANAPFASYKSISQELYPELERKTGARYRNLRPDFIVDGPRQALRQTAVSITNFFPATVNAGALLDPATNLLTIQGSGFGTPSGLAAVFFDDANDGAGGASIAVLYDDPLIVSWTDTEIQVRVPSRAGTGNISVRDDAGLSQTSGTALNVLYSILTATFNVGGINYTKESNLMNANGSGGYTIAYSTNTAGSAQDFDASTAKATFQRALATLNRTSGYNVIEGGTTTVQIIGNDGVNAVMFDNANTGQPPLPDGVLAVCYSYNSICTGDLVNFQARKLGFDIVVRNPGYSTGATVFSVGPCPPNSSDFNQIDLETVLLHELGHSLNLGHINDDFEGSAIGQLNPGKLMNFAVVNSVKRTSLDQSAKAGASYAILPQGNAYGNCTAANTEMTPLATVTETKDECPTTFPTSPIPQNTTVSFDLVNATSNRFVDPSFMQVRCDGLGAAQTNNAYYAFRTDASGGSLLLSVNNYTTEPADQTSCSEVFIGIPVTGVRLSLYLASACPAAGAYPTPVACATINGNGALSPIPGLAANTDYLIYVDGIENTKASFDLVFGGTVLPVRFTDFTGTALESFNRLAWKADLVYNTDRVIIQKSTDGINFSELGQVSRLEDIMNGSINDYAPFAKTFYRLAVINSNGSIDYSNTVMLRREVKSLVSIYPNPVKDKLYIQVNTAETSRYEFRLYNGAGQLLMAKEAEASAQVIQLPVGHLAKGLYQLTVARKGEKMETHRILVD